MLKNLKDWRTTVPTAIGIVFTLLGVVFPDWFTSDSSDVIAGGFINIATGLGVVITWITGLLSRGGTS